LSEEGFGQGADKEGIRRKSLPEGGENEKPYTKRPRVKEHNKFTVESPEKRGKFGKKPYMVEGRGTQHPVPKDLRWLLWRNTSAGKKELHSYRTKEILVLSS